MVDTQVTKTISFTQGRTTLRVKNLSEIRNNPLISIQASSASKVSTIDGSLDYKDAKDLKDCLIAALEAIDEVA